MTFEFTAAGRWFIRNAQGQIVTQHFDSFDAILGFYQNNI